nr:MAG TPA: hypothetical protein [Bacteriophage sp.]
MIRMDNLFLQRYLKYCLNNMQSCSNNKEYQ